MRAERLFAALAACVSLLAPAARAGGTRDVTVADDVHVSVRWTWPDMLDHGAQPIFVEVENRGGRSRRLDANFQLFGMRGPAELTQSLELEPGEHAAFELCAPVFDDYSNAYQATFRCAGEVERLSGIGAALQPERGVRNVLLVSGYTPQVTLAATWTRDLSSDAAGFWTVPTPRPTRPSGGFGGVLPRPAAPARPTDLVRVTPVTYADLATQAACYSSLDAVVVEARGQLPSREHLATLAAYARSGGLLLFRGGAPESFGSALDELAPWTEERFRLESSGPLAAYACGQGVIAFDASSDALDAPRVRGFLELLFAEEGRLSLAPRFGGGRGHRDDVDLPGLEPPHRALMAVLFLFAIVIGPVNLLWVRRARKPALLLVTVPVIAIVFSLGLFAYGALAQGLDVRARRLTTSVLDQRSHRSTTLETREIFVGLATGRGLRPSAGAWLFADPESAGGSTRRNLAIDFTDGVEFGDGFLPARSPTRQTIVTDRAARGRVELRRTGDHWSARFGLGAQVRDFAYRDGAGARFVLRGGPVEDGAEVELVAQDSVDDTGGARAILAGELVEHSGGLPRGTYWALLATTPFADDLGLEAREVDSRHEVLGIVGATEAK